MASNVYLGCFFVFISNNSGRDTLKSPQSFLCRYEHRKPAMRVSFEQVCAKLEVFKLCVSMCDVKYCVKSREYFIKLFKNKLGILDLYIEICNQMMILPL